MAIRHLLAAALLLGFAAASVTATPECTTVVSGESPLFGTPDVKASDYWVDQTANWQANGDITKLQLFYSYSFGCVFGVKPTYGYKSKDAALFGVENNLHGEHLVLGAGETFVEAQYKAGAKCLEYLRLKTNKGRTLAIGDAKSSTMTATTTVNQQGGFLASVRGWADKAGALQQLRLVWGLRTCPAGAAAPAPAPVAAVEVPQETLPAPEDAPEAEAEAEPVEVAPEEEATPAAGPEEEDADGPAEWKAVCAPQSEMCDASPSAGVLNSCRAVSPFTKAQCVGGCCVSSGRCKFGSCFANGLGKEAPLSCFGTNFLPNPLALLGNKCGHLACKLAVPGCKTAVMGGACVGTVVAVQDAVKLHPLGAKYLGYPCVETTPTAGLMNMPKKFDIGLPQHKYALASWKACDCAPSLGMPDLDAPGLAAAKPTLASLTSMSIPAIKLPDMKLPEMPRMPDITKMAIPRMQIPEMKMPQIKIPDVKIHPLALIARAKNGTLLSGGGAGGDAAGDASLGGGSTFTVYKDLLMGQVSSMMGMQKEEEDPFAAFAGDDAAGGFAAVGGPDDADAAFGGAEEDSFDGVQPIGTEAEESVTFDGDDVNTEIFGGEEPPEAAAAADDASQLMADMGDLESGFAPDDGAAVDPAALECARRAGAAAALCLDLRRGRRLTPLPLPLVGGCHGRKGGRNQGAPGRNGKRTRGPQQPPAPLGPAPGGHAPSHERLRRAAPRRAAPAGGRGPGITFIGLISCRRAPRQRAREPRGAA
ncbi:MAG: hypothetical protein J3K34DRAFT_14122 [Monoraphidium minutum]|nr:MAG: hypothetical protein J3K34DRAFT_14122 [Monoraphidium minutum]